MSCLDYIVDIQRAKEEREKMATLAKGLVRMTNECGDKIVNTGNITWSHVTKEHMFPGGFVGIHVDESELYKPERVIYNGKTTVCYFPDGEKTVVTATDDEKYTKEHGVAMCIIKKLFNSRLEFLRIVENGHVQEDKK